MKRIALIVAVYALLNGLAEAQVGLPFPGPGGVAGTATSCSGANFELDFSNNCNLIYYQTVIR